MDGSAPVSEISVAPLSGVAEGEEDHSIDAAALAGGSGFALTSIGDGLAFEVLVRLARVASRRKRDDDPRAPGLGLGDGGTGENRLVIR